MTTNPIIVSAGWDKVVKVFNLTNCKLKNNLYGHTGYINTVTVSPDGSLCASGGKVGGLFVCVYKWVWGFGRVGFCATVTVGGRTVGVHMEVCLYACLRLARGSASVRVGSRGTFCQAFAGRLMAFDCRLVPTATPVEDHRQQRQHCRW
jgi:hypothetical protein